VADADAQFPQPWPGLVIRNGKEKPPAPEATDRQWFNAALADEERIAAIRQIHQMSAIDFARVDGDNRMRTDSSSEQRSRRSVDRDDYRLVLDLAQC
jgi:hypothetical protein